MLHVCFALLQKVMECCMVFTLFGMLLWSLPLVRVCFDVFIFSSNLFQVVLG